jgi:hypothetical protein
MGLHMNARSELSFASAIIAFCMFNYFYLIPTHVVAEGSSMVYPALINTMLLLFALAYWAEGFLLYRKEKLAQAAKEQGGESFLKVYWRPISLLAITAIWIFTIEWAGFLLTTIVFLFCASHIFAASSLKKVIIFSLALPLIVFSLFYTVNAPLPEGPLEAVIFAVIR